MQTTLLDFTCIFVGILPCLPQFLTVKHFFALAWVLFDVNVEQNITCKYYKLLNVIDKMPVTMFVHKFS